MIRRAAAAVGLALVVLLSAACSDSNAVDVTELEFAPRDGGFSDLMVFVPDDEDFRWQTSMIDLARIRSHLELSPSEVNADPDSMWEMLEEIGIEIPDAMILGMKGEALSVASANWERALGVGLGDLDYTLEAGFQPDGFWAASGSFDPTAIDDRLRNCGECAPAEELVFDGQPFYSWGEDDHFYIEKRLTLPWYDALGRGGRLMVTDEFVLRANYTAGMFAMIAFLHGAPSLDDNSRFAQATAAADGLGLFAVRITDQTQDVSNREAFDFSQTFDDEALAERMEAAWTPPGDEVLLRPYIVAAIGPGIDDSGPFTGIVLVHKLTADAEENVDRLAERIGSVADPRGGAWSETFTSMEATTDGTVLVAKLRGAAVSDLLYPSAPLLLHE